MVTKSPSSISCLFLISFGITILPKLSNFLIIPGLYTTLTPFIYISYFRILFYLNTFSFIMIFFFIFCLFLIFFYYLNIFKIHCFSYIFLSHNRFSFSAFLNSQINIKCCLYFTDFLILFVIFKLQCSNPSIPVFPYDALHDSTVLCVLVVIFIPVKEHDHICILFNIS